MNQKTSNPPGITYQNNYYGLEKYIYYWCTYAAICS